MLRAIGKRLCALPEGVVHGPAVSLGSLDDVGGVAEQPLVLLELVLVVDVQASGVLAYDVQVQVDQGEGELLLSLRPGPDRCDVDVGMDVVTGPLNVPNQPFEVASLTESALEVTW